MVGTGGSDILQIKRTTIATRGSYTPANGELLYETDSGRNGRLHVGDGSTAGGNRLGPFESCVAPSTVVGHYYSDPRMLVGASSQATSANLIGYHPFCTRDTTWDQILINVVTAGTGSARLGIFDDVRGKPGSLVLDAGTVALTSTGLQAITVSEKPDLDWWHLAYVTDDAAAVISHINVGGGAFLETMGWASLASIWVLGWAQVHTFGALPATASSLIRVTTPLPMVMLRAS